jgi:hypothetical protein
VVDTASYVKLLSPLLPTLIQPARFRPVYRSLTLADMVAARDVLAVQKVVVVVAPDVVEISDVLHHIKRSVLLADRIGVVDVVPHLAYEDVRYYGPSASIAYTMARIPDAIRVRDLLAVMERSVAFSDVARIPDWFGTRPPATALFRDSAGVGDVLAAQRRSALLADAAEIRDVFTPQKL